MRTTATSVCLLAAIGAANAFIMPAARSVSVMPNVAALRMSAGSEASKAGDDAQDAARHLKNAGQDALFGNASTRASSTATSSTTTVPAATNVGAVGVTADSTETVWEAPVEKVRIHEREEIVDKTRVEEQRIRTEVQQVVQPIKDMQTRKEEVRSIDHGTEIREQGRAGLDANAEAELKKRRDQIAVDAGTKFDKQTKQTNLRPDVDKKEFVNTIEQVVPVIERDIYVPKKVEHEKKIVEIYNEAPVIQPTEVKPILTKEEFERQYGGKVEAVASSGTPTAHTTKVEAMKETKHTSSTGGNAVASSSTTQSSSSTSSKTPPRKP